MLASHQTNAESNKRVMIARLREIASNDAAADRWMDVLPTTTTTTTARRTRALSEYEVVGIGELGGIEKKRWTGWLDKVSMLQCQGPKICLMGECESSGCPYLPPLGPVPREDKGPLVV